MNKQIIISPSPHVHSGQSVEKLMYGVIIALLPALLVSIFFYGKGAIAVTLISVASCIIFEFLIQKYILKTQVRIHDGSAIVTGMLLAFNLPSNLPWWIIVIGALVSIGIAKMTFGGIGNNPFNPALVGRVFLLVSFPAHMTTNFPYPQGISTPYISHIDGFSGATPLGIIKEGFKNGKSITELIGDVPSYTDMFIGKLNGSLGEIAGAALLLGLIYMLIRRIITWHIPVSVVGSFFLFISVLWIFSIDGHNIIMAKTSLNIPYISYTNNEGALVPFHMADPVFHMVSGGLFLGAFFMATDYVTSPMVPKAMIIFGVGIGIITGLIRIFGAYPEGISFAILIMNGFVPLMNRYIKPKRFGQTN
ncbi:MAG: RnfABCDGE type electron transport complex subunit D [Bacteroidales bacterium]|nr:RnfABCDGE type electron transport complex subunit D [Bacteroidales bacterium]